MSLSEVIYLGQKILLFKTPAKIVDEINLTYDNNIKELKKHNQHLAGKIVDEHKIDDKLSNEVKGYFRSCFMTYLMHCKIIYNINLASAWVNEMKANEYNPIHHHTGKESFLGLSSVMMLKKPKTYGEEYSRKDNPGNGHLEFIGSGGMLSYNQCKIDAKV